jgi:hypothetical protein
MKDDTITVDIENTSSRVSELDFVVGFTGAIRQTMSTGRMKPGEHRQMTAEFRTSDNTGSVFLRPLK